MQQQKSRPIPTSRGVFADRAQGVQVRCAKCRALIGVLTGREGSAELPPCPNCNPKPETESP